MKTPIALGLLTAGYVLCSGHAVASDVEVRRQVVRYADLDLSKQADAATLLRRIRSAASVVCGGSPDMLMPTARLHRLRDCAERAVARAVADVQTQSTQRHAARDIPYSHAVMVAAGPKRSPRA